MQSTSLKFEKAIVREPSSNFADGLTSAKLGPPDYSLALDQFENYCSVLSGCGLEVIRVRAEGNYPDSTFVEDTAVLTEHSVIMTRPGADTRRGEVELIAPTISKFRSEIRTITQPGTLEGGDVCQAGTHFFIGLSHRTNDEGAKQLSDHLAEFGYTSSVVDIRAYNELLHLKSGLASLNDGSLVVCESLFGNESFKHFERIRVSSEEDYACNCLALNDNVLIADGFPKFHETLDKLGFQTIALNVSEFRKMDGGLSCLSLRF